MRIQIPDRLVVLFVICFLTFGVSSMGFCLGLAFVGEEAKGREHALLGWICLFVSLFPCLISFSGLVYVVASVLKHPSRDAQNEFENVVPLESADPAPVVGSDEVAWWGAVSVRLFSEQYGLAVLRPDYAAFLPSTLRRNTLLYGHATFTLETIQRWGEEPRRKAIENDWNRMSKEEFDRTIRAAAEKTDGGFIWTSYEGRALVGTPVHGLQPLDLTHPHGFVTGSPKVSWPLTSLLQPWPRGEPPKLPLLITHLRRLVLTATAALVTLVVWILYGGEFPYVLLLVGCVLLYMLYNVISVWLRTGNG